MTFNIYCWGCEKDLEEKDFQPNQLRNNRKYKYCRSCYYTMKEYGHYPKTLLKMKKLHESK